MIILKLKKKKQGFILSLKDTFLEKKRGSVKVSSVLPPARPHALVF